jgi:hypothetical protein
LASSADRVAVAVEFNSVAGAKPEQQAEQLLMAAWS